MKSYVSKWTTYWCCSFFLFWQRNASVDAEIATFRQSQIIAIGEGFDFNKVYIVCEGMMLCTILHQSIVESIISLLSSFFIVNMVMAYKGQSDLGECQHTFQWHFQFVIVKCIEKSPTYLTEQIFAFFFILLRFGG